MDKIWYRNPLKSEVIDRCGEDEKTRMTKQNRQKKFSSSQIAKKIFQFLLDVLNYILHIDVQ